MLDIVNNFTKNLKGALSGAINYVIEKKGKDIDPIQGALGK